MLSTANARIAMSLPNHSITLFHAIVVDKL
jgi:hypothetical protein